MINKIKELLMKYRDIISYLFFGAATTLINVAVYSLCYDILNISNGISTVVAWFVSVAFAFVTNKLFVFKSRSWDTGKAIKEAGSFFACRVGSGAVELAMMYIFVDIIGLNGTVMKLITNIIVIVINYIFSKLFIFKKED